jgi:hypothetical protein
VLRSPTTVDQWLFYWSEIRSRALCNTGRKKTEDDAGKMGKKETTKASAMSGGANRQALSQSAGG